MATARFYHGIQRYLLGFETFSRLLFYAACIAGIVFGILNFHWLVAGIAFLMWLLRFTYKLSLSNARQKKWVEDENTISRYLFSTYPTCTVIEVQTLPFLPGKRRFHEKINRIS